MKLARQKTALRIPAIACAVVQARAPGECAADLPVVPPFFRTIALSFFVQAEIGHQLFQPAVLLFQTPQPLRFPNLR